METQPKLRDSKKEPEAATGGKVRVPMPRTAPAVPLLQDPEKACWKGCNRSWVKKKKKKKCTRSTNPAFAVLMENSRPERAIKDKKPKNTETVSTAFKASRTNRNLLGWGRRAVKLSGFLPLLSECFALLQSSSLYSSKAKTGSKCTHSTACCTDTLYSYTESIIVWRWRLNTV